MKIVASPFGQNQDISYMNRALEQARKAYAAGEVPVGALIVDAAGQVLAESCNAVEREQTQTAHAEMIALAQAGKSLGDWRLEKCWLYVTLEPCAACLAVALLSRVEGIVFGALSPLFGQCLDKNTLLPLYRSDLLKVVDGVCAQEAAQLLRQFFKERRSITVSEAKNNRSLAELEAIKQDLLVRKHELEAELKQLYQEKFSDDQVQDTGDQALSSTMESLNNSLQTTKLDEYKRLTLALEMLKEGTYGKCVDCQSEISSKRLRLFPNAARCLACQELYEEAHGQKFE